MVKLSDWINLRIENQDARKASSSGSFSGADQVRTGGLVTLQGLLRDGHSPPQRVRSTCTCRMTSQLFRITQFGSKGWMLEEMASAPAFIHGWPTQWRLWVNLEAKPRGRNHRQLPPVPPYRRIRRMHALNLSIGFGAIGKLGILIRLRAFASFQILSVSGALS